MANILMSVEGPPIKGEAVDKGFEGWIKLDGYAWSVNNETSMQSGTSGGGSGKAHGGELTVYMPVDKSSVECWKSCCKGVHHDKVTIAQLRSGGKQEGYVQIILEECKISTYSTGADDGDSENSETIIIKYNKSSYKYTEQSNKGVKGTEVTGGFDFAKQEETA